MDKKNNISEWKREIIIGGLVAIFSFALPTLYDWIKNLPFLTTLKNIGHIILSILIIDVKIWHVIIFTIILILLPLIIIPIIASKKSSTRTPITKSPIFASYTEDKFKKWKWSWDWILKNDIYEIENLQAHCPDCDTILMQDINFSYMEYTCPRCNYFARNADCDNVDQIEHLILDEVKRKGVKVKFL